jgi:hypothetical protein
MPDNLPELRTVEIGFPPNLAMDLCLYHLIAAYTFFCEVPDDETPGVMMERLKEMTASDYGRRAAREWIETLTTLFEAERG